MMSLEFELDGIRNFSEISEWVRFFFKIKRKDSLMQNMKGSVATFKSPMCMLSYRNTHHSEDNLKWKILIITVLFLGGVTMANAKTLKADTTDADIQKLEQEKKKAELERDIAKLKTETAKVNLPTTTTTALEGKITLENVNLPSQIFTYKTVFEIGKQAGSDIMKNQNPLNTLVVYSEKELGGVVAYKSALTQLDVFVQQYMKLISPERIPTALPPAALAPEFATTFIKSIADIVALFRTDTEISKADVTVDDVAVVAELARGLRENNSKIKVIYPPLFSLARSLRMRTLVLPS